MCDQTLIMDTVLLCRLFKVPSDVCRVFVSFHRFCRGMAQDKRMREEGGGDERYMRRELRAEAVWCMVCVKGRGLPINFLMGC